MKRLKLIVSVATSTALLAACGGGNHDDSASNNMPRFLGTIGVPNVTASSKTFSYDAGQIADGNLYLTDRNNKSVDVVNPATAEYALITGSGATAFAGDGKTSDQSGPNSVQRIPNTAKLYATDVSSIKVIDVSTRQITRVIDIVDANGLKTGNRADGSCLDREDNIVMTMSSADNFVTWIDATTDKVINRFDFPDHTAGLEVCVFDPVSKQFFVNNDATATNPDGELDAFPVASVKAGATPILARRFPLPLCNPNGLDLGPGNDIIVACDASVSGIEGRPFITLILDRTNGAILSKVPFGGSDLVAYDPASNRYFLGSRNWQSGGLYSKALPKNPVLGVIDAATRQALPPLAAGTGAHSVIVDSANQRVYVPYAPTAGSASFASGGIGVYTTH
jgi:sugar lactone lactonase YvrE